MIDLLNKISGSGALAIWKLLVRENTTLARRVEQLAKEYLSDVDPGSIAEEVYDQLNFLQPEEVWDRSGNTRDGYINPTEAADELFEETLEPFVEELNKYMQLSMDEQAKSYCMGILKGIRKFEKAAATDYKDWAPDSPDIHFDAILDGWRKRQTNARLIDEMNRFIDNGLIFEDDSDDE